MYVCMYENRDRQDPVKGMYVFNMALFVGCENLTLSPVLKHEFDSTSVMLFLCCCLITLFFTCKYVVSPTALDHSLNQRHGNFTDPPPQRFTLSHSFSWFQSRHNKFTSMTFLTKFLLIHHVKMLF